MNHKRLKNCKRNCKSWALKVEKFGNSWNNTKQSSLKSSVSKKNIDTNDTEEIVNTIERTLHSVRMSEMGDDIGSVFVQLFKNYDRLFKAEFEVKTA